MNIVMHCGGIPFNGNTIKEKSLGGSESAAYYMARELVKLGHEVKLFTNHPNGGKCEGVGYIWSGDISESFPLGEQFEFYARNTPHDVLIIQRHPSAFKKPYAAKRNILWLHDLALIRQRDDFLQQMWNIDGVFTVSEYHKNQVCEIYGIKRDIVHPVLNGVDETLFSDGDAPIPLDESKKYLTYSSRPERGLEHLVKPGGIMERLATEAPECHLLVCGYDNTTEQMRQFYEYLWARCRELDNVTNLGNLTKHQLAQLMKRSYLHVYPTEFEEVSCITAMETAMAGLPLISSEHAALPETCKGSGAKLLPLKDGAANDDAFVEKILKIIKNEKIRENLSEQQLKKASEYSWSFSAKVFECAISDIYNKECQKSTIMKHMMRYSDIVPMSEMLGDSDQIESAISDEYAECYKFYRTGKYEEHYAAYYEYEKNRGVNYGPESLEGNLRFEHISNLIGNYPADSIVVDYGCAHGHYTINLAKRFPAINFIGIDIAASNIAKAKQWAAGENITNVEFHCAKVTERDSLKSIIGKDNIDCILCCEVLEHVGDVDAFIDDLTKDCDGDVILTTPYGPWEGQGYQEHWPWRAHLYEFERTDLEAMFGHMDQFNIAVAPAGQTAAGEPLGSYITTFRLGEKPKPYRKAAKVIPRLQTVTLAMIAKDAQFDIERCLKSALPICDEVIIGIDETTKDSTLERALKIINTKHGLTHKFIVIKSPMEIGFDEARNQTIKNANGDWILWLDTDEELHNPIGILPYLRNNQFDGYALSQHHISAAPPGIIKTDNPCKLFRNKCGIKFYGIVHEHPEQELGKAIPHTMMIRDSCVMHYGYSDEPTRRKRFQRNLDLLVKDREKYPNRTLSKFLWIRDLAQMSQYELEYTGIVSRAMLDRAEEGVKLWRELMHENIRMAVDALPFYSSCVRLLGKGFEMSLSLDTNLIQGSADAKQVRPVEARFYNEEHAKTFQDIILHERVKNYESRYF